MIGRLPVLLLSAACIVSVAHAQDAQPTAAQVTATTAATATAAAASAEAAPAGDATPAAPAAPAPKTPPVVRNPTGVDMAKEYLIGPEDVLDITVWKNCPDLCRTVPVH